QLSLLANEEVLEETSHEIDREIVQLTKRLKESYIKNRLRQLEIEIKKAQDKNDKDEVNKLSQDFNNFTDQLKDF
ncbi:hypothetical protein HOD65_00895, partial [bacterium]|nr:hypothetical protein [bacterium]